MVGDFNEILKASEKKGGRIRENWSFTDFQNMVRTSRVSDLPYKGDNMTLLGKRRTYTVECWLDRAMANDEWNSMFPASEVEYLELIESDHRPAIIKIQRQTEVGPKPFLFDARLCNRQELNEIVRKCWSQDMYTDSNSVQRKLKESRAQISKWRRKNNTNSAKRIKELKMIIDKAHTDPSISIDHINLLRRELDTEYKNEEKFWYQKSRVQWLKEGDRNTRFFHASSKNRIARNRLCSIVTDKNETVYGNQRIAREAERYFTELFTSTSHHNIDHVLRYITPMVTEEMNESLIKSVTDEEVKNALFSIGPTKAPGPDGFTALFFQQYWEYVGPTLIIEVKQFFETGDFPQE